ncbi:DUF6082 family protein [Streptomyces mesophilus]|uniref:DUF6082 family protein n=1 Tax=Streptomyces mesophilus TaxID=1775132 RepID=UPI00331695C3
MLFAPSAELGGAMEWRSLRRREVAWAGATAAVLAVIVTTPFLLDAVAPDGLDWGRLSDVSQTYGAVSVFLSAAALLGVIASLAYQARQTRIAHEETQRSTHRELILQSINDPDLMPCWEPPVGRPVTRVQSRQILFVNLIVNSWRTDFRLRRTGDAAMTLILDGHFRGEIGRLHWQRNAAGWRAEAVAEGDRRSRRFVELADEAYARAVSAGPPMATADYYLPAAP